MSEVFAPQTLPPGIEVGTGVGADLDTMSRRATQIADWLQGGWFIDLLDEIGVTGLVDAIVDFLQGNPDPLIALVGDVPFVSDILDIIRKVITGEGLIDLPEILEGARDFIGGLRGSSVSAAKLLTELQAKMSTGAMFSDTFDRADNATTLGNGWVQGGAGQSLGIEGNAARIDNDGSSAGVRYAICPVVASSDDHAVSAPVNFAGVATGAMTSLFVRANADLTEFVYANVYRGKTYLGRGTRSGTTWSYTDWASNLTEGASEGALIEVFASGTTYWVAINGNTVLSHIDVSSYPVNASHRTVGFSSETRTVLLLPQYSWGLGAFALRDVVLNPAANTAVSAQETAIAAASAVAELQSDNDGGGSAGITISDVFTRADASSLGSDWVQSGTAGKIGIASNVANWLGAGGSESWGNEYVRHVTSLLTDDQSVRVVIGTGTNDITAAALALRATTNFSSFVGCRVLKDSIEIGYGSYSAGLFTFTTWTSVTRTTDYGATVELRAVGISYEVKVNNAVVLSYSDSGGTAPIGASNRSVGLIFARGGSFGFHFNSWGAHSFNAADLQVPATKGTGWELYRSSGTVTASVEGGYQPLAVDVYDHQQHVANVLIANQAQGSIQILRSGWYNISVRFQLDRPSDNDVFLALLYVFVDGVGWTLVDTSGATGNDGVYSVSGTFTRYCEVGEVYRPGFKYDRGVAELYNKIKGDTLKTVTYFKGVLVSP